MSGWCITSSGLWYSLSFGQELQDCKGKRWCAWGFGFWGHHSGCFACCILSLFPSLTNSHRRQVIEVLGTSREHSTACATSDYFGIPVNRIASHCVLSYHTELYHIVLYCVATENCVQNAQFGCAQVLSKWLDAPPSETITALWISPPQCLFFPAQLAMDQSFYVGLFLTEVVVEGPCGFFQGSGEGEIHLCLTYMTLDSLRGGQFVLTPRDKEANIHHGMLFCRMESAHNLVSVDREKLSDPFGRLWCHDIKKETGIIKDTLDPEWNEHFEWPNVSSAETLYVEVSALDSIIRSPCWCTSSNMCMRTWRGAAHILS